MSIAIKHSSPSKSQLLAAGFNAHGQILASAEDVRFFTPIELFPEESESESESGSDANDVRVLFPSWSSTAFLLAGNRLRGLGYQGLDQTVDFCDDNDDGGGSNSEKLELTSAFGDHNGMLGCLDRSSGILYLVSPSYVSSLSSEESKLVQVGNRGDDPSLTHIAIAGNSQIAFIIKQAPHSNLCQIRLFPTFHTFLSWYQDLSSVTLDPWRQHFVLPGRPKQLVAGTGVFVLLMEGGEVYSWGDARYGGLGRDIGHGCGAAERPGMVEALGGLKIVKVALGGWMGAALSVDWALYLWGVGAPGTERTIRCLREAAGNVVLVELPRDDDGSEPLDVVDVGIGDNHVAVVAEGGRLFVVGDNGSGQLGLGREEAFFDDWVQVQSDGAFQHVVCGPKSTFAFLKPDHAAP